MCLRAKQAMPATLANPCACNRSQRPARGTLVHNALLTSVQGLSIEQSCCNFLVLAVSRRALQTMFCRILAQSAGFVGYAPRPCELHLNQTPQLARTLPNSGLWKLGQPLAAQFSETRAAIMFRGVTSDMDTSLELGRATTV